MEGGGAEAAFGLVLAWTYASGHIVNVGGIVGIRSISSILIKEFIN